MRVRLRDDPAQLHRLPCPLNRSTAEYLQRRAAFNATPLADLRVQDPACFLVAWGIYRHCVAPAFPQRPDKTGLASWPCMAQHTAMFHGATPEWRNSPKEPERWAGPMYDQASIEVIRALCPSQCCQLVLFPGELGGMYHPPDPHPV